MTEALLMFGDTERSPDLFAAVPAGIGDPFAYVETAGRRIALIGTLDHQTIAASDPGIELLDPVSYGMKELILEGIPRLDAQLEACRRLLDALGVDAARVPWGFPVALADVLRAGGIAVTVDATAFGARRRVKSPLQLAGIRRAQHAADTAMGVGAELVHACAPGLTAEAVRAAMQEAAAALRTVLPDDAIVAVNGQGASGHDSGSGPIAPGDVVLIDIWPQDRASRCWADMTRTFMAGGVAPVAELAEYWSLSKAALDAVTAQVRAGAHGRALHDTASAVFEAAGKATQRTAPGDVPLREGFFHGLGHGIGFEIHESPGLGLAGDELVVGDVVAVEPGCYRTGFGGVRLEDLLLVTADGCEVLTQFPYEL